MSRACSTGAILFLSALLPAICAAQGHVSGGHIGGSPGVRSGFNHSGSYPHYGNYGRSLAAYPVFVGGYNLYGYGLGYGPGYGDGSYDPSAVPPDQPNVTVINNQPAQPPAPVIINQYFGTPGGAPTGVPPQAEPDQQGPGPQLQQQSLPADDPAPAEPRTFLIAYKDHSVYSALAYWIEDHTLHYVTTSNTHNQADLSLIDIDFTTKLNGDRNMPFSVSPAR